MEIKLSDVFKEARNFADYSLRHMGQLRPTFFVHGEHPIVTPSKEAGRFIQMHVIESDMASPAQKDKVALMAKLLNAANGATACCLMVEAWMSNTPGELPSEAPDRKEYVVLLGESHTEGRQSQILPIVRSDNQKFWGIGEHSIELEPRSIEGRFANLLPPIVLEQADREFAHMALLNLGMKMRPVGPLK